MSYKPQHPEEDPAEGSRKVIDRELARQRQKAHISDEDDDKHTNDGAHQTAPAQQDHRPM